MNPLHRPLFSLPRWLCRRTIEEQAREELLAARRDLMQAEASLEEAEAVRDLLLDRIARLEGYDQAALEARADAQATLPLTFRESVGGTA